ncbi:MAG: carbohydrate kinase, partial [Phaeodactylibacter sp.]|nr:carbohydrate kinase [Phaeodactylibacter sp.]
MHGLVLVDAQQQVLRPSIIWCDSRAVGIGQQAFDELGEEACLSALLNSPGNFTASKLAWVKQQEPALFARVHKFLLPGDYIAMRLTGEILTTASGLSEGIFWDFKRDAVSEMVLDYFGFQSSLVPDNVPTFSLQGTISREAAQATGLAMGTPVGYRAGDQPNNALALNVLQPGEVAATGGTSGVVYGVTDTATYDPQSRVNSFLHVNHQTGQPRIGVLLCINGAGSQYAWLKKYAAAQSLSYPDMEQRAAQIPVGSDGLITLPFGNGAERMLDNQAVNGRLIGLQFNRHRPGHLFRSALEGIAHSFVYGVRIQQQMGLDVSVMRVGNDNLFQSGIFAQTIATLLDSSIEVIKTTGAVGAAKAAGVAVGLYANVETAMQQVEILKTYEPQANKDEYGSAYQSWAQELEQILNEK